MIWLVENYTGEQKEIAPFNEGKEQFCDYSFHDFKDA